MDDGGRAVEEHATSDPGGTRLAAATNGVWRTGAVGHLRSRLAGRAGSGAASGEDDRRCDQLELGPFRGERRHGTEHGRALGISGEEWPDGGYLHGPRLDVYGRTTTRRKQRSAARGRPAYATRARPARVGDRLYSGVLAASQGAHRTQLPHSARSFGEGTAIGEDLHDESGQRVSGKRVLAGVE